MSARIRSTLPSSSRLPALAGRFGQLTPRLSSLRPSRLQSLFPALVAAALAGTPLTASAAPAAPAGPVAASAATDPLESPLWPSMQKRFFDGSKVVFDPRVTVVMPPSAEDPLLVPVEVAIRDLDDVEEVLLFADLNPLPKILEFFPRQATLALAFRLKVEQSTPVRAAARTADGVWHVGGSWVSAAGGGCTMPSVASGNPAWQERLGEVSARQWSRADGGSRLRLRVIHPMDTGLAAGIPVFHIDTMTVRDEAGAELARLVLYEPVSENPVLSLDLKHRGAVRIDGRDTQGNPIAARVAPGPDEAVAKGIE